MTEAVEALLARIWAEKLATRSPAEQEHISQTLSLVAIGGFGRRELAPFSDVDLLFVHADKVDGTHKTLISELVRSIWDAGLSLGQNVGSVRQLTQLAAKEVLPATSFLDARFLLGSQSLFERFVASFQKTLKNGRGIELFMKMLEAVQEEHQKFGATVHLLEPNVKKTAGGLRDIHLTRWAAHAVHGSPDLSALEAKGVLGMGDASAARAALEFLLRVRCDLHFHAGKDHDDLLRADQIRIASDWGYQSVPGRLGVERFMADYFSHSTAIADILERFVERTKPRTLMANARQLLLSRRVADGVVVGPDRLILSSRNRRHMAESLEKVWELAEIAARHRVRFDYHLTEALRKHHLFLRPDEEDASEAPLNPKVAAAFLRFLATPGTLSQILRILHRVGVLEQIIPEFEHARCLLQFNAYHKFTVDEHTFVVLAHLESFAERDDVLGRAYAAIERKDLLHLAVLLHDLGKGFQEDHSEVGRRLAERTAERLGLSESERDIVVFLVHKHLLLSDLAMKRDVSDPRVWVRLSKEAGDIERLRMLYVLTCADVMGVGPGVYTRWTAGLLEDLYRSALSMLAGQHDDARSAAGRWEERRKALSAKHSSAPRMAQVIEELPEGYLADVGAEEVDKHLALLCSLPEGGIDVVPVFRPETKITTYTVIANEKSTDFIFSKICGALAAHHMDVLAARIYTLADGTIIDQFDVRDTHFFGDPTPERVKKVETTIRRILNGDLTVNDALYSSRSSMLGAKSLVLAPVDTRVTVDNNSSETCTVIDVFTNNRRGLLYTLARGLALLQLSIYYAKIATYEDEAADVFYVRQLDGQKVNDPERMRQIREHLTADVELLASNPRVMGF